MQLSTLPKTLRRPVSAIVLLSLLIHCLPPASANGEEEEFEEFLHSLNRPLSEGRFRRSQFALANGEMPIRRSSPLLSPSNGKQRAAVKMHNLLGGNILVQQSEGDEADSPYVKWDLGRGKPLVAPRLGGHRLSQESIGSAIKKILMGIH